MFIYIIIYLIQQFPGHLRTCIYIYIYIYMYLIAYIIIYRDAVSNYMSLCVFPKSWKTVGLKRQTNLYQIWLQTYTLV